MRLIDANALKDILLDLDVKSDDLKWKRAIEEAIQKIFPKIIDDQPTIKVENSVQKKKGYWIYHSDAHHYLPYQCSVCKHFSNVETHFCPHCGAQIVINKTSIL